MFEEDDLDLNSWFDDEDGSHWFRRLLLLVASAALVYYYTRAKSHDAESVEHDEADTQPHVETQTSRSFVADDEEESQADDDIEDEQDVDAVEPAPVIDVIAAEFAIVDDEYVIDDEEEITEDTEIDLALEEAIENGDLDDDWEEEPLASTAKAGEERYERLASSDEEDDEEDPLEGVLAETDDEDLEEQVLEPSPAPDEPPKWVAPVNGECPDGHPIKARFSTGRFHVPGDRGYEKIVPDCCYENTDDTAADGFTHSRWS